MNKYGIFIRFMYIAIAVLVVCIITFTMIGDSECERIVSPNSPGNIHNYKFDDRMSRVAAESVAEYKAQGTGLAIPTLSDYAVYLIATTDIVSKNLGAISIVNHPRYVEALEGYDLSLGLFKTDHLKSLAIEILGGSTPSKTDRDIFDSLANPISYITV